MSMPSSPCRPAASHTSRETTPSFSHCSWNGAISFVMNDRTVSRKVSCSSVKISRCMPWRSSDDVSRTLFGSMKHHGPGARTDQPGVASAPEACHGRGDPLVGRGERHAYVLCAPYAVELARRDQD